MSRDPLQYVLQDVVRRFGEGERHIRVPVSWRKYVAGLSDRLFGK